MYDRHWEDRYLVSTDDEMAPNNVGSDEGDEDDEDDEVESAESSTHGIYSEDPLKLNWKVAYLYRTVKDFLKTAQIQAKFERSTSLVTQFNPELSLLLSFVINLKRSLRTLGFDVASLTKRVSQGLQTALKWVEAGDTRNHECAEAFLEFLDQAYKWRTDPAIFPSRPPSCAESWTESISLAVWSSAWKCVQYSIETTKCHQIRLLYFFTHWAWTDISPNMPLSLVASINSILTWRGCSLNIAQIPTNVIILVLYDRLS
jgi:hypothetical protein